MKRNLNHGFMDIFTAEVMTFRAQMRFARKIKGAKKLLKLLQMFEKKKIKSSIL